MSSFDSEVAGKQTVSSFELETSQIERWCADSRFEGVTRLYSARQVAEQQGTIPAD